MLAAGPEFGVSFGFGLGTGRPGLRALRLSSESLALSLGPGPRGARRARDSLRLSLALQPEAPPARLSQLEVPALPGRPPGAVSGACGPFT